MAKPSTQLLRTIQIGILAIVGFLLSVGIALANAPNADQLTQTGFGQFYAGQFSLALKTWKQAETIYHQQDNSIGVSGSLINQSLAQQAVGQHLTACYSAAESLAVAQAICRGQSTIDKLSHYCAQTNITASKSG
jgi:hypothetical protein